MMYTENGSSPLLHSLSIIIIIIVTAHARWYNNLQRLVINPRSCSISLIFFNLDSHPLRMNRKKVRHYRRALGY